MRINWLRTITAFDGPELQVEVMELDESGYPRPTGRFETLAADTLIMALGQETESAFMRPLPGVEFDRDGSVRVSAALMTGCPGVFAGGDMVPSERTVTVGVGHGKKAAHQIDAWLSGRAFDDWDDRLPVVDKQAVLARQTDIQYREVEGLRLQCGPRVFRVFHMVHGIAVADECASNRIAEHRIILNH